MKQTVLLLALCSALARSGAGADLVLLENESASPRGHIARGDVDVFAVDAPPDSVLLVSVHTDDGGEFDDPALAIFAPGEATPRQTNDDGGPGFLPRIAMLLDQEGRWEVAVSGSGDIAFDGSSHNEEFDYRLDIALVPEPDRIDEQEGQNDQPQFAPELTALGGRAAISVVTGELKAGDVDHFRVPSGRVLLAASLFDHAAGEFNDSLLRVLDREGAPTTFDDDGGPGFLSNLTGTFPRCNGEVVSVGGFDPDPDDKHAHREDFGYHLVVATSSEQEAPVRCELHGSNDVKQMELLARGIDAGRSKAEFWIRGKVQPEGAIDLGRAELRIVNLLADGGQERIRSNDGEPITPLALESGPKLSPDRAFFETSRGKTAIRANLLRRDDQSLVLWMRVLAADVRPPISCDRALLTRLEIDDGTNPPVTLEAKGPWSCQLRPDGVVERMRLSVGERS